MNTRIQVEHPVTEMITGVDLVQRAAAASPPAKSCRSSRTTSSSAAMPSNAGSTPKIPDNFMPCPGLIKHFHPPGGPGVRVDSHIYEGYQVPPNYDSMIGKLIVHGDDREQAIAAHALRPFRNDCRRHQDQCAAATAHTGRRRTSRGGPNIHYLEKRMAERKDKGIGLAARDHGARSMATPPTPPATLSVTSSSPSRRARLPAARTSAPAARRPTTCCKPIRSTLHAPGRPVSARPAPALHPPPQRPPLTP